MPISNESGLIETRQHEIAKEMKRLQEEADELAIAMKVIKRLSPDSTAPAAASAPADKDSAKISNLKLGPRRPSGLPTNCQMVDMILASAEKEGKDGLTVNEIIAEMRSRYWPGLQDRQVSTPIYAFARKGRFKKTTSGKFKRIKNSKDGADLPAEEALHAR